MCRCSARSVIVVGMQLCYYGAAVIKIRDYTQKATNGHIYTPVPDWGWILAAVAGVFWLIIAGISACARATPCLHNDPLRLTMAGGRTLSGHIRPPVLLVCISHPPCGVLLMSCMQQRDGQNMRCCSIN
jgi:hypothetical protein